jgi:hypothetical protein
MPHINIESLAIIAVLFIYRINHQSKYTHGKKHNVNIKVVCLFVSLKLETTIHKVGVLPLIFFLITFINV